MVKTRLALFRCDADQNIGMGHLMRCQAIAIGLKAQNWQTTIASSKATFDFIPSLSEKFDHCVVVPESDLSACKLDELIIGGYDLCVIDHYKISAKYETLCRRWAKKIVVLDDLANREHDCDILVDTSFGRNKSDYAGLMPSHTKTLFGPSYAPLDANFWKLRHTIDRRLKANPAKRILISFGGADTGQLTETAVKAVNATKANISLDVVMPTGFRKSADIEELCRSTAHDCSVHKGTDQMSALMAQTDISIGAAGVTAWERCSLGVPSIVVVAFDNQKLIAKALEDNSAALVVNEGSGDRTDTITKNLKMLIANHELRLKITKSAASLCDGLGTNRIISEIYKAPKTNDGKCVSIRRATEADLLSTFKWQSDPRTRKYFTNPTIPDFKEHRAWFTQSLRNPNRILTIVELEGQPSGVLRFDRKKVPINTQESWYVSIYIDLNVASMGLGSAALKLGRRLLPNAILIAEVLDENIASRKVFEKNGYIFDKGTYLSNPEQIE